MARRYTHRLATHLHKIIIQNSKTTSVYVWVVQVWCEYWGVYVCGV